MLLLLGMLLLCLSEERAPRAKLNGKVSNGRSVPYPGAAPIKLQDTILSVFAADSTTYGFVTLSLLFQDGVRILVVGRGCARGMGECPPAAIVTD